MGYYTWTDARLKHPRKARYGNYRESDVIPYNGWAKIVCPDNTEIIEPSYYGYGMFGGYDIYELVVDWNKDELNAIFDRLEKNDPQTDGLYFRTLAVAYQNDDKEILEKEINRFAKNSPCFKQDWKREIGITIADNDKLTYPIKITTERRHVRYDELYPSISTQ